MLFDEVFQISAVCGCRGGHYGNFRLPAFLGCGFYGRHNANNWNIELSSEVGKGITGGGVTGDNQHLDVVF